MPSNAKANISVLMGLRHKLTQREVRLPAAEICLTFNNKKGKHIKQDSLESFFKQHSKRNLFNLTSNNPGKQLGTELEKESCQFYIYPQHFIF